MIVWYFAGRLFGPPPTSMYFESSWLFGPVRAAEQALDRASSSDNNFVGVEMANDFGLDFFGVPEIEKQNYDWILCLYFFITSSALQQT